MDKCQLFQNIAETVWDLLARNNERGNRLDERGITGDRVVSSIQDEVNRSSRFNIFAQKTPNEVNTGGDLELYVEDGYRRFTRILLQAKTSETNGNFTNLDRESGSTGRKQYDTLQQYATRINSSCYYLFYNGIPNYHFPGKDCVGMHDENQFGCAIIDVNYIKDYCESNNTGSILRSSFNHPIGRPWRFLACCDATEEDKGYKKYTPAEIDMDPHFANLFTPPPPVHFITSYGDGNKSTNLERVNSRNFNGGWIPQARIIVTTQSKLKKDDNLLKFV
jgi:hypothetical protein